ncbi:5'-3' exonuclease [Motilibacter peucedani]|uniref:5'-3' exonuclease n=1 Tax=Motilibacter peucedani TaxID=598650 RepID=A0A420XK62_9ACTN|nr:5'-3' exonuclease [Motilibacter peucedani]RKS67905.1 5'-3' exonuclease [Motilibacter peucedani]
MAERLMVVDAPSLYFRAFFGVPDSVTAPDGTPVNAVRGFLDFLARLVKDRGPTRLVAAMDASWRPDFRVAALPSYKAHRVAPEGGEVVPDAIVGQVPVIEECLRALGIASFGVPGYEADDVIGSVVQACGGAMPADVVTGDRDLFQLVDDTRRVRVLYVGNKGVGAHEVFDQAKLSEKYGVASGDAYADFALLRGDPSDGLPGVAGIGEKTAASLLARYGTLAGVLDALERGDRGMTPAVAAKLRAATDYLAAAPVVVRVARDAPLPPHDDRLPRSPADPDAFAELVRRWGLGGSADRLLAVLARP